MVRFKDAIESLSPEQQAFAKAVETGSQSVENRNGVNQKAENMGMAPAEKGFIYYI